MQAERYRMTYRVLLDTAFPERLAGREKAASYIDIKPICALCQKPVDQFRQRDDPAMRPKIFSAQCHGRWEEKAVTAEEMVNANYPGLWMQELLSEWFKSDRDKLNTINGRLRQEEIAREINDYGRYINDATISASSAPIYTTGVSSIVPNLNRTWISDTANYPQAPSPVREFAEYFKYDSPAPAKLEPKPEPKPSIVSIEPRKRMITLEE